MSLPFPVVEHAAAVAGGDDGRAHVGSRVARAIGGLGSAAGLLDPVAVEARGFGRGKPPDWLIVWVVVRGKVGHQKNLSGTMMVSPGLTTSLSFTRISDFSPLTMRTIRIRVVDPRSTTPPASESACRTVVLRWGSGYAPGFLT